MENWEKSMKEEDIAKIEKLKKEQSIKPLVKILSNGTDGKESPTFTTSRRLAARSLKEISETNPNAIQHTTIFLSPVKNVLFDQMKGKDAIARLYLSETLDHIGWTPNTPIEKIHYLIAKRKWQDLAEMGDAIVTPLNICMQDDDCHIRLGAYKALNKIKTRSVTCAVLDGVKLYNKNFQKLSKEAADILSRLYMDDPEALMPILKKCNILQGVPVLWSLCQIGNPGTREKIIDWLFDNFVVNNAIWENKKILDEMNLSKDLQSYSDESPAAFISKILPVEVMEKLFGQYTDIILNLFRWKSYIIDSKEYPFFDVRYDMSACVEALQKLFNLETKIANNILNKTTSRHYSKIIVEFVKEVSSERFIYLERKDQIQLTKEELKRRGNPAHDPSHYLDSDWWDKNRDGL